MNNVLPDRMAMYNALLKRDTSSDGIFFVAVKTTGIFCRPICRARKPKIENVEFFDTARSALLSGYRPCKLCNPLGCTGDVPDWLKGLLKEIEETPGIKLRDFDLMQRNISPHRVRRWFKSNLGMTFQTYLRTLRIGKAFGQIKYGEKVTNAAFDANYESLSGFASSFKKTTGFSPVESNNKKIITVTRIPTPLGPMLAGAIDDGICLLEFVDRRMIETQLNRLKKLMNAEILAGTHEHFKKLTNEIKSYFDGKLKEFTVPLSIPGTPFQKKVWSALQKIPYGETRSYQEQAGHIGNPKAVRAVARANGDNRIAIIIPCHRVIGSDGKLVGYGGGLRRKQYLLNLESGYKNLLP